MYGTEAESGGLTHVDYRVLEGVIGRLRDSSPDVVAAVESVGCAGGLPARRRAVTAAPRRQ